jgi:hypothetical protein
MKWASLFLLLMPCAAFGQGQPLVCTQVTAGNSASQVATAITGKNIVVCGYALEATGAGAFQLAFGTGSNCGTGTIQISPSFSALTSGAALADHVAFAYATAPTGSNLCVLTSTSVSWAVYWGQF